MFNKIMKSVGFLEFGQLVYFMGGRSGSGFAYIAWHYFMNFVGVFIGFVFVVFDPGGHVLLVSHASGMSSISWCPVASAGYTYNYVIVEFDPGGRALSL